MKSAVAPLPQEAPPTALDEVVAQLNDAYIEKGTPMFLAHGAGAVLRGFATFACCIACSP